MTRSSKMKRMAMGATTVLASMLALAGMANAHVYNETMDPFNINKNQSEFQSVEGELVSADSG